MDVAVVAERTAPVVRDLTTVLSGRADVAHTALATLLAGGHLLLEDVPGVGKTTLARALAAMIGASTGRIQFTPDLLPGDVTGVSVYRAERGEFQFHPGPVFHSIVVADEINRASPKTQAALLECMQERRVTIDGVTHDLPELFLVVATQNPVDMEGTYPLPEAQQDRFMARCSLGYPSDEAELELLASPEGFDPVAGLTPHLTGAEVLALRLAVGEVHVSPSLRRYVLDIVQASRLDPLLTLGASPRAGLHLVALARAIAALAGRDHVLPDDVKHVAVEALAHRLVLAPAAQLSGTSAAEILGRILARTRTRATARP